MIHVKSTFFSQCFRYITSYFKNVLAAEFENATSFSSLMRANTPVSRMMTTYTRYFNYNTWRGPGQVYLKGILLERVNKLLEVKELNLEINPLKVYEQMMLDVESTGGEWTLPRIVTTETAMANIDVQAIITPRVKTLMEIAASFLSIILSSLDFVPYGIRWICKQIRSLTKVLFLLMEAKVPRSHGCTKMLSYRWIFYAAIC